MVVNYICYVHFGNNKFLFILYFLLGKSSTSLPHKFILLSSLRISIYFRNNELVCYSFFIIIIYGFYIYYGKYTTYIYIFILLYLEGK